MYARPLPIFQILKLKNMQLGIFSNRPFFQELFFLEYKTTSCIFFFFWKRKMVLGVRKIVRLTMTNDQGMAQAKMDFFGSGYSPKYKAVGSHLSFMRVISHQRIQVSTHCKLSKNTRYYASSQDLQMSLIAFGLVLPNDRKEHECYLLCFGTHRLHRISRVLRDYRSRAFPLKGSKFKK